MERKIKQFHTYQILNGVLLVVVISLLIYALYPLFTKTEDEKIQEKITLETGITPEKVKAAEEEAEAKAKVDAEGIQEKKGQTLEEALAEKEALPAPQKPALVYRTVQMEKTKKADIPTLDFAKATFKESEHKGDMRVAGKDCGKIPAHLRITGDLHIYGTGAENCQLPKGLIVLGSVYVKGLESITFQNDLKVQKKIYIRDDTCVSVPISGAEKVVLSDGVKTCN